MPFQKVAAEKISGAVIRQIEELILQGVLRPGDRLPAERELAERMQVSRPSLREAIGVLEAKGLLESRRGGGTFVRDVMGQSLTDPLLQLIARRPEATSDVLELRHALEETAAQYAATRATPAELEVIGEALQALQAVYDRAPLDPGREAAADSAFIMAIAEASHNVALVHVMRSLQRVLEADIASRLQQIHCHPGDHDIIKAQHARIYREIAARDAGRARAAMRDHLEFVHRSVNRAEAPAPRA